MDCLAPESAQARIGKLASAIPQSGGKLVAWKSDRELFALIRDHLSVAIVGDVLDQMGYTNQFLPPRIRPLRDDMIIVGRAMPVLQNISSHRTNDATAFGKMFEALDSLKDGEVYLCAGAPADYALWGQNMSTRAIRLGAAGAVVDGYSRDTHETIQLGFPTFSWGPYAKDQRFRGKVTDFGCSIAFPNDVEVEPGDIVFGNIDGVVIIPQKLEVEAVEGAFERATGEDSVQELLTRGKSAQDAFRQYGIM